MAQPEATPPGDAHRFSEDLRRDFPGEVGSFDQFEEEIAAWQRCFRRARGMAVVEEQRFRETGLLLARRQIGHVAAGLAIRVVDLASGLILLINARHAHPAYATARSLVETAAVACYAERNVVPLLAKARRERADEVLLRLAMGADPGLAFERRREVQPIRVGKIVGSLCTIMDESMGDDSGDTMRRLYSSLSDHSHPNYSAVHLSSTLGESGMTWDRSAAWDPGLLHELEGTPYLAMHFGRGSMDAWLDAADRHPLTMEDKRAGE